MIKFIISKFGIKSEVTIKHNNNNNNNSKSNASNFDEIYFKIYKVINDSNLLKKNHIQRYNLFLSSEEVLESLLLQLYHNFNRLFEFQNLKKFYEYNYRRYEGNKIDYLLIKGLFDKLEVNVNVSKAHILGIKESKPFHQKYWPFNTVLDLDKFLISKVLKNLSLEPFSGAFNTIDGFTVSIEYYYKLVSQKVRESNQVCINELKIELNEVEYFKEYSRCSYLNEYVSILKSLINFLPIIEANEKESDLLLLPKNKTLEKPTIESMTNFLKRWFINSKYNDLSKLLRLELDDMSSRLELKKHTTTLSLFFIYAIEKGLYSRQDVEMIYDSTKLTGTKGKINKNIFGNHYSRFSNVNGERRKKTNHYLEIDEFFKSF